MLILIITTTLTAISSIFLAVGDKEKLKKLRISSLTVIGGIASAITAFLINYNGNEQQKKIDEVGINMQKFENRLDSLKESKEPNDLVSSLEIDYEKWASEIRTNLNIRELKETQLKAQFQEEKLSKRLPLTANFNFFISSIKNYSDAYNNITNKKLEFELPNLSGVDDEAYGIIRGNKNTYLLNFKYESCRREKVGQITFQRLSNGEYDAHTKKMDTADTLAAALQDQIFKLQLATAGGRINFNFDTKENSIHVNEFNEKWKNEIFDEDYDLSINPEGTIDLLAKKLVEELLFAENKDNTV